LQPPAARPLINYSYQALPETLPANRGETQSRPKRSVVAARFRQISREFLGAEMSRNYVGEFLFFAVITSVSAWPIVSMLQAVERWVK
jgi:hypothetical protein